MTQIEIHIYQTNGSIICISLHELDTFHTLYSKAGKILNLDSNLFFLHYKNNSDEPRLPSTECTLQSKILLDEDGTCTLQVQPTHQASAIALLYESGLTPEPQSFFDSIVNNNENDALLCIDAGTDITSNNMLDWAVLEGVKKGMIRLVKAVIQHGVNLHQRDRNKQTLLHHASGRGGADMCRILLESGSDVHAQDDIHETPLHVACGRGFLHIVYILLEYNAVVNNQNIAGLTPLHMSARWHPHICDILIEKAADIHVKAQRDTTVLHEASRNGDVRLVTLLLDAGASPQVKDRSGSTPLHIAALSNNRNLCNLLIARGAVFESKSALELRLKQLFVLK